MRRGRIIIPLAILLVAGIVYFFLPGILYRVEYERDFEKNGIFGGEIIERIIDFEHGYRGNELFTLLRDDKTGSAVIEIMRQRDDSILITVINWGVDGYSGLLSEDEYNNFTEYIENNNVGDFVDFYNRDAKDSAEYVYLHCSNDNQHTNYHSLVSNAETNSFRFNEIDTGGGNKYADLVNLFENLINSQEVE